MSKWELVPSSPLMLIPVQIKTNTGLIFLTSCRSYVKESTFWETQGFCRFVFSLIKYFKREIIFGILFRNHFNFETNFFNIKKC